jgi:hypothetical protein
MQKPERLNDLSVTTGSARLLERRDDAWRKYYKAVAAWEKARERMAGLQWKAEALDAKCSSLPNVPVTNFGAQKTNQDEQH